MKSTTFTGILLNKKYFHTTSKYFQQNKTPQNNNQPPNQILIESNEKPKKKSNDNSNNIFDVSMLTWQQVIESKQPIILHCYAEFAKDLLVPLKKFIDEQDGDIKLANLNCEAQYELIQQLKLPISNLPTLFLLSNSKVVANVVGSNPNDLQVFLDRALGLIEGEDAKKLIKKAEKLIDSGNIQESAQIFKELIEKNSLVGESLAGLAIIALNEKDMETAKQLLNQQEKSFSDSLNSPISKKARSAFKLFESLGNETEGKGELLKKIEANPKDNDSLFKLSKICYANGNHQEAIDHLLQIIKNDKFWNQEAARNFIIEIFNALGPDSEITKKGRKRFSSIFFN